MNTSTSHPEKKEKLSTRLGPFSLSVLLHAAVLVAVGGTVIYDKVIPKTPFMAVDDIGGNIDTTVLEPETLEPEQMQEPTVSQDLSTPISAPTAGGDSTPADILVSTGINNTFSLPPAVGPPSAKIGGTSGLAGSGGTTASTAAPTAKGPGIRTSSIFGQQVEASSLGVVFDISYSTHNFMDKALEEVEKGFPDALIVLAPGCGMTIAQPDGKVLPGNEFMDNIASYTHKGVHKESATFLPDLLKANKRFESLWRKSNADGRLFVAFTIPPMKNDGTRGTLAQMNGNQIAFEFLMDKGVDTIYWLADFQDNQSTAIANALAQRLKKKKIRVIQHDFDKLPTPPEKSVLATVTGGKVLHLSIDGAK